MRSRTYHNTIGQSLEASYKDPNKNLVILVGGRDNKIKEKFLRLGKPYRIIIEEV